MYSVYNKQTDWGQFAIFDASEIQISKGYTSALYGPNTMGGAINLTTKKPTDKLEIEMKAQYSFPAQHSEYVRVGTNLGVWYAQFSFSQIMRDYYDLSNSFTPTSLQPNKHRINSHYDTRRYSAKTGFTPNSTDEYSLNFIYQTGSKGGLPSTANYIDYDNEDDEDKNRQNYYWDWPYYNTLILYWASTTRFFDFITLDSRVYYTTFENRVYNMGAWTSSGVTDVRYSHTTDYEDYTIGGNVTLGFEITPQDTLKFHGSVKNDNHKSIDYTTPYTSRIIRQISSDISDITYYGSAEYAHAFNKSIHLVLNSSYTHNEATKAKMRDTTTYFYGFDDPNRNSIYGWGLQGILYIDILDNLETYITAGRKTNMPTIKERYGLYAGQSVPNPDLQAEAAINVEAGLNYYPIDTLKLSFAAYYDNLSDMIVKEELDTSACSAKRSCFRLVNARSGYIVGFEVGLEYNILDTLQIAGSYSYTQKRSNDGTFITDVPHHLAKFRAKYTPIDDIDLILGMRFTGSRITEDDYYNYVNSPSVFLLDVRVAYRPSFADWIKGLEIAVGVDNVTDKNYWYKYGYEQSGRVVYLEASYKY